MSQSNEKKTVDFLKLFLISGWDLKSLEKIVNDDESHDSFILSDKADER